MTREEYIGILTDRLQGIDEASLRDIILEIEDHIDGLAREHPEKRPEEVIGMLEPPESLADSLREAAGLGPYSGHDRGRPDAGQAKANRENGAETNQEGGAGTGGRNSGKKKVHITIDDEDLHEAIRKAFDIAKLFSRRRREWGDDSFGDMFADSFAPKDISLSDVRRVKLRARSADVRVLFSNEYFSIDTPGEDKPHLRMEYSSAGALKISVPLGYSEPERIELRVPASVDELEISTLAGEVHILDRVGPLVVSTASGDIRVDACDGDLQAKSASGDITLSECRGDIKVSTASGDIGMRVDEMCNSIEAASASGDIALHCSEDWDATVTVSTVSGEVEHDGSQSGRDSIRIGSGLVPVRISTVSGDISVRRE